MGEKRNMFNTIPADGLAIQGAKASAAMILTYFSQNTLLSTLKGLTNGINKRQMFNIFLNQSDDDIELVMVKVKVFPSSTHPTDEAFPHAMRSVSAVFQIFEEYSEKSRETCVIFLLQRKLNL